MNKRVKPDFFGRSSGHFNEIGHKINKEFLGKILICIPLNYFFLSKQN